MNFLEFASSLPLIKNFVQCKPDIWHTPRGAFISQSIGNVAVFSCAEETFKIYLFIFNKVCFQAENSFVFPDSTNQAKGKTGKQEAEKLDDVVNAASV